MVFISDDDGVDDGVSFTIITPARCRQSLRRSLSVAPLIGIDDAFAAEAIVAYFG